MHEVIGAHRSHVRLHRQIEVDRHRAFVLLFLYDQRAVAHPSSYI
jgi:hypothetical protein